MDQIVEKIAREVMLRLRATGADRGTAYVPPAGGTTALTPAPARQAGGQVTAVLLTANFKVIEPVMAQVRTMVPAGARLLLSDYLLANFPAQINALSGVEIQTAKTMPAYKALTGVGLLLIPSLSLNTMSKAANLIADSYATQVISHALCDGIPVEVSDETIIEAGRFFPAGVARRIDALRRELEAMGVKFNRGRMTVAADTKCARCAGGDGCSACNVANPAGKIAEMVKSHPDLAKVQSGQPLPASIDALIQSTCKGASCGNSYGSCVAACEQSVRQLITAGAARVDKGGNAAIPAADLAPYIDHTLLKPDATEHDITKLCEEARKHTFASVCVNPGFVKLAARLLAGSPVMVCTVVGFPLGATSTFTKVMETRDAIANGASEIDMVINVGALKAGDFELVRQDIARVVEAASGHTVKVILETSLLKDDEKVKACELSKQAGADFVKTSTGFGSGGATVADIALMRKTVGPSMGVKASGGIRDTKTAQDMVAAGATRIGASASVAIIKGENAGAGKY